MEKAKAQGIEMTLQEAEIVLVKPSTIELDENSLASVSGGNISADHVSDVHCNNCGERAKYDGTWQFASSAKHHIYRCECGYLTEYVGDEFVKCFPEGKQC